MDCKPVFPFEKLEVWQMARLLNRVIYQVTCGFPKSVQFGLTSQVPIAPVAV